MAFWEQGVHNRKKLSAGAEKENRESRSPWFTARRCHARSGTHSLTGGKNRASSQIAYARACVSSNGFCGSQTIATPLKCHYIVLLRSDSFRHYSLVFWGSSLPSKIGGLSSFPFGPLSKVVTRECENWVREELSHYAPDGLGVVTYWLLPTWPAERLPRRVEPAFLAKTDCRIHWFHCCCCCCCWLCCCYCW